MEQLSSLRLTLKPLTPLDKSLHPNSLGPYLQGALMERVDPGYASVLHDLPFNPYSQYCTREGDCLIWRVSTLTKDATLQIIEPLRQLERIELRGIHTTFEVLGTSQETLSQRALTDEVGNPGDSRMRIRFVTPTSFKSQGSYVIMPSVRLIFQNLLMHYGQVYEDNREGYEETVEYLDKQARITAYDLRSSYFGNVSGNVRKIPGFMGTMTMTLRGSEMACGLVRMLLRFAEFSGIGIKTSMGMGGAQRLP